MLIMSLAASMCVLGLGEVSEVNFDDAPGVLVEVAESSGCSPCSGGLVGFNSGSPLADFNGDGILNFFDISAFLACYQAMAPCADLNGDGFVDYFDIALFISY